MTKMVLALQTVIEYALNVVQSNVSEDDIIEYSYDYEDESFDIFDRMSEKTAIIKVNIPVRRSRLSGKREPPFLNNLSQWHQDSVKSDYLLERMKQFQHQPQPFKKAFIKDRRHHSPGKQMR